MIKSFLLSSIMLLLLCGCSGPPRLQEAQEGHGGDIASLRIRSALVQLLLNGEREDADLTLNGLTFHSSNGEVRFRSILSMPIVSSDSDPNAPLLRAGHDRKGNRAVVVNHALAQTLSEMAVYQEVSASFRLPFIGWLPYLIEQTASGDEEMGDPIEWFRSSVLSASRHSNACLRPLRPNEGSLSRALGRIEDELVYSPRSLVSALDVLEIVPTTQPLFDFETGDRMDGISQKFGNQWKFWFDVNRVKGWERFPRAVARWSVHEVANTLELQSSDRHFLYTEALLPCGL